ncbi:MAG: DUF2608 domain-containing protein [Verrucomicrobia bacterium]|nr:DUF2608 domain-containing protein [Verrucomicrobiota bacterium]
MRAVAIIILSAISCCGILFPQQAEGSIVEISSLEEIQKIERNTLIVLDIDDTLLYYPYDLGSEMWFREAWEEINRQSDAQKRQEAIVRFHEIAALLAQKLDVAPVEEKTAAIVREWQCQGAYVMAITARALGSPALEDWQGKTLEQLNRVGVHLGYSAPVIVGQLPTDRPSSYRDGILFLGPNNKGDAILLLLDQMETPPQKVVVIDDRKSDIDKMVEALVRAKVPFCAYWYRAQEGRYALYDRNKAAKQLHCLLQSQDDSSIVAGVAAP